jgi:hypothetical protein
MGSLAEAALCALLAKLVKNKSWNKDTQGHAWTKEADLLGQAPVNRPQFAEVKSEAEHILSNGEGTLFLTKGGSQGKTPKEWSIQLKYVPLVKAVLSTRDFRGLAKHPELMVIAKKFSKPSTRSYRVDGDIVNQRVLDICRR